MSLDLRLPTCSRGPDTEAHRSDSKATQMKPYQPSTYEWQPPIAILAHVARDDDDVLAMPLRVYAAAVDSLSPGLHNHRSGQDHRSGQGVSARYVSRRVRAGRSTAFRTSTLPCRLQSGIQRVPVLHCASPVFWWRDSFTQPFIAFPHLRGVSPTHVPTVYVAASAVCAVDLVRRQSKRRSLS